MTGRARRGREPTGRRRPCPRRAALAVYGGPSGADSTLRARLANFDLATLVASGESDQIVDPDYGRAYAAAIPGAQFELLKAASTRISHHSTIAGPHAEILGPQIGPRITEDHPDAMADLIAAAASRSKAR